MNTLELNRHGLMELDSVELENVEGGDWWDWAVRAYQVGNLVYTNRAQIEAWLQTNVNDSSIPIG